MAAPIESFAGSMPEYYDSCLGPAWFDGHARDIAHRLPLDPSGDVLEIACGTGLVTRQLRERLDPARRLVATDISRAMLDYAQSKLLDRKGIEWREADAVKLPFGAAEFGAVVCAFGIMYVPDKTSALSEARRVLKEGGLLLFSVWDRIEDNPCSAAAAAVLEELFPDEEEARFNTPFEMYDPILLRRLLAQTGFQEQRIERKRIEIAGISAHAVATGQIRGTPRSQIVERHGGSIDDVVSRLASRLERIGEPERFRAWSQAVVVEARAIT